MDWFDTCKPWTESAAEAPNPNEAEKANCKNPGNDFNAENRTSDDGIVRHPLGLPGCIRECRVQFAQL